MNLKDITIWFRPLPNGGDFIMHPFEYNSYDAYIDAFEARIAEIGADEYEAVDWEYIPSDMIRDYGLDEEGWEGIKACAEAAKLWSVEVSVVIEMLSDEGWDIDSNVERVLDDHVVGQWTLEEYAWHLVEEGIAGDDALVLYFDYKKFGDDLDMSGDLYEMLLESYDEEEADTMLEDITMRGGANVAEWYFNFTGTEPSDLDAKTLTSYFDFKMYVQDLGYSGYTMYGTKSNPILFHNY